MRRASTPSLIGATLIIGGVLAFGGTAVAASGSGSDGADDRPSSADMIGVDDDSTATRGTDDSTARGRDRDRREIRRSDRCSGSSRWKFKVKNEDNNRLEIEFEVDQNRNGQRWGVVLKQNGRKILRRTYRTGPPSGSFEARKIVRDRRGRDRMVAIARNVRSGERCTARINF